MNVYEVSNPSDRVTLLADSDAVAACAGLALGEGRYGITRGDETVLPIFLLGGFKQWADEVGFDPGDIAARWREITACLRTAAIGNPPEDVRRDLDRLAAWNNERRTSMNDIPGRATALAKALEVKFADEPAPFAEIHERSETRDKAIADLHDPALARLALPALYLSTGRYTPDEAKRAKTVMFGFCDAAGKIKAKADATHVGWSLA